MLVSNSKIDCIFSRAFLMYYVLWKINFMADSVFSFFKHRFALTFYSSENYILQINIHIIFCKRGNLYCAGHRLRFSGTFWDWKDKYPSVSAIRHDFIGCFFLIIQIEKYLSYITTSNIDSLVVTPCD